MTSSKLASLLRISVRFKVCWALTYEEGVLGSETTLSLFNMVLLTEATSATTKTVREKTFIVCVVGK